MYQCERCKQIFGNPKVIHHYSGMDGELDPPDYVCPLCGWDEYEEDGYDY